MKINFHPQTNDVKLLQANEVYSEFWQKEKDRIIKVIEKISALKFKNQRIEAVVYEGISKSQPLMLRASYSLDVKKATLIHELCHILLTDNQIKFESKDIHDLIYLILFDIWNELYGKDFAEKMVEIESSRDERYKKSWEKALLLEKENRLKKFLETKIK